MKLRVARGAVEGGGTSEGRAEGVFRQSDRSSWGSIAGTESLEDGAAEVAGPQPYAACICGQLRCERVLATAGGAWDADACCGLGRLRAGL